jgi:glycosyltransferase involved in cell wall biosynthesis
MRILYLATDQTVPGTKGGSVHVTAVATGLAALGHEVHVFTGIDQSSAAASPRHVQAGVAGSGAHWHSMRPALGVRQLRFLRSPAVRKVARSLRPDVVMERYYNFGGEGLSASAAVNAPYVLEVNAPVVDYPGSPKRTLDKLLVVEPMRRWRDRQCAAAALLVTPSSSIVPTWVPRERILEVEWGADTVRFHPGATGAPAFTKNPGEVVAIFAGAFRRWHGAIHVVEAVRRLRERGSVQVKAVMIGEGPELTNVRRAAAGLGVTFSGAVPHDEMPASLAAADIGVAPFDVDAHAPLAIDFYWSPLKVFEYMASGLPVIAPDVARLRQIVGSGREGVLYDSADPAALALAMERLAGDDGLRRQLGGAARERVVAQFGWDVHCRALDAALRRCVS